MERDVRGACLHEAIDRRTPVDAMMRMEEEENGPLADEREMVSAKLEEAFWLLEYFFDEGPHPALVMRRLYFWVKKYRPSAVWDEGWDRLGNLLGDDRDSMEWRIEQFLKRPSRKGRGQ